jgi:hypothetical protein
MFYQEITYLTKTYDESWCFGKYLTDVKYCKTRSKIEFISIEHYHRFLKFLKPNLGIDKEYYGNILNNTIVDSRIVNCVDIEELKKYYEEKFRLEAKEPKFKLVTKYYYHQFTHDGYCSDAEEGDYEDFMEDETDLIGFSSAGNILKFLNDDMSIKIDYFCGSVKGSISCGTDGSGYCAHDSYREILSSKVEGGTKEEFIKHYEL